jgi:hypothetical protein
MGVMRDVVDVTEVVGPGFRLMSPASRFTKMSNGRRPRGRPKNGVLECFNPLPGRGFVAHKYEMTYAFDSVTWSGFPKLGKHAF